MGAHTDDRSQLKLLIEAAEARRDAEMFHRASLMGSDGVVNESLAMRAAELNKLARQLETQAGEMAPSADTKTP